MNKECHFFLSNFNFLLKKNKLIVWELEYLGKTHRGNGEGVLPHTDSTHVACLKDTVWGAFLISFSYYVCKSVLLFGGNGDIVPPHA